MWRNLLTYPQAISPRAAETLDTLAELVPVPTGDRYVALAEWLDGARRERWIDGKTFFSLRSEIAPNM